MLAVYLTYCLTAAPPRRERAAFGLLGAVLGFAVLVEYSNGLLVIIVSLYLLWHSRPFSLAQLHRRLLPFALLGLPSAIFLAYYNNSNFGSPFTLSYSYAVNYPWAGSFGGTFSTPLGQGLQALIFYGEGGGWCGGPCFNQGFLLLSPILWAALPGLWLFWRHSRRAFFLVNTVFLVYLLLFAKHHTAHGFTGDGRYLTPFLGLLAISLGYALQFLQQRREGIAAWVGWTAVAALFALSWRNMFVHIGNSYNYQLDFSQLDPMVAHPQNYLYLARAIFPNSANLPYLWLLCALLLLISLIFSRAISPSR